MNEMNRQDEADRLLWQRYVAAAGREGAGACPDAVDVAAWLEGRATPSLAERIEGHLAGCGKCLQAVEDLRAILAAPPVAAPRRVLERAEALARAAARPTVLWLRVGRWAGMAAAAVLVAYAGFAAGVATREGRQAVQAAVVHEATFGLVDGQDDDLLGDELLALMEVQP